MIPIRNLARSGPRFASRISTNPANRLFLSRLPQLRAIQALPRIRVTSEARAAFSTSRPHFDVNGELQAKLESEIALEKESRDKSEDVSSFLSEEVKDFLDSSGYELHDTPGVEEVMLTRKIGDEKIKVIFNVADMNAQEEEEEDPDENDVFGDDDDDIAASTQSGGAHTKGASEKGRTPDGNIKVSADTDKAPADRPEIDDETDGDESPPRSFPVNVQVIVERQGKGALACDATINDGEYMFVNLSCYADAELANPTSPNKEYQRRNIYTGPPFTNLDEDLQLLLERYFEERGVDTRMALFIPEYIDFKEQKEYERWLNNLKNFVS